MDKTIVYLATPYSDPNPIARLDRYNQVNKVAAKLMAEGIHIFSPISHCHGIQEQGNLPETWEYWKEFDKAFLKVSKKLIVLKQPGWERSIGVKAEIKIAKELGIPIEYMEFL